MTKSSHKGVQVIIELTADEAKELIKFGKKRSIKDPGEALKMAAQLGFKRLRRKPSKYDIRSLLGLLNVPSESKEIE